MPQQINLCSPIQITQKQSFSAHTMAQALVVFLVLGGILCGAWVWNVRRVSEGFNRTLADQARDIAGLKAALDATRASAAPVDAALLQQLQARRAALVQREQVLKALQQGVLQPGKGHSDRLQLVAQTIPAPVWISEVTADSEHFDVAGFTLEPAALNEWVNRLSASALMQGLKLATVQVENTALALSKAATPAAVPPGVAPARAVWSFNLVSAMPQALPAVPESKP